jgi:hypothetical protein
MKEKRKDARRLGGSMRQFHDTELQQSETVVGWVDTEPVSGGKRTRNVASTVLLAVAAIGILAMPLSSFLSTRAHPLPEVPIFIGTQSRPVNTDSAVLAVDTSGLTIRAKNASASTQELFEQAAVRQLARLHRTYSNWADRNHELMGILLLKLTVDARGTVVRVDPVASHVTNPNFTKTVMADVSKWKFPKGAVEAAEITIPLLFVPKGMDPDTVVQWERKVRSAQEFETSPAGLGVADTSPISTVSEAIPKSLPSVSSSGQTNTTRSSTVRFAKPNTEKEALIVVKTNRPVSIRENPRFSGKRVHEVDGDTQLSIVESRGDWLKVKLADARFIGFVRKEFVSPIN